MLYLFLCIAIVLQTCHAVEDFERYSHLVFIRRFAKSSEISNTSRETGDNVVEMTELFHTEQENSTYESSVPSHMIITKMRPADTLTPEQPPLARRADALPKHPFSYIKSRTKSPLGVFTVVNGVVKFLRTNTSETAETIEHTADVNNDHITPTTPRVAADLYTDEFSKYGGSRKNSRIPPEITTSGLTNSYSEPPLSYTFFPTPKWSVANRAASKTNFMSQMDASKASKNAAKRLPTVRVDNETIFVPTDSFSNGTILYNKQSIEEFLEESESDVTVYDIPETVTTPQPSNVPLSHMEILYPGFRDVVKQKPSQIIIQNIFITPNKEPTIETNLLDEHQVDKTNTDAIFHLKNASNIFVTVPAHDYNQTKDFSVNLSEVPTLATSTERQVASTSVDFTATALQLQTSTTTSGAKTSTSVVTEASEPHTGSTSDQIGSEMEHKPSLYETITETGSNMADTVPDVTVADVYEQDILPASEVAVSVSETTTSTTPTTVSVKVETTSTTSENEIVALAESLLNAYTSVSAVTGDSEISAVVSTTLSTIADAEITTRETVGNEEDAETIKIPTTVVVPATGSSVPVITTVFEAVSDPATKGIATNTLTTAVVDILAETTDVINTTTPETAILVTAMPSEQTVVEYTTSNLNDSTATDPSSLSNNATTLTTPISATVSPIATTLTYTDSGVPVSTTVIPNLSDKPAEMNPSSISQIISTTPITVPPPAVSTVTEEETGSEFPTVLPESMLFYTKTTIGSPSVHFDAASHDDETITIATMDVVSEFINPEVTQILENIPLTTSDYETAEEVVTTANSNEVFYDPSIIQALAFPSTTAVAADSLPTTSGPIALSVASNSTRDNYAASVDTTTAPVAITTTFSASLQTTDITKSAITSDEATTLHENLTTFLHSDGYNPTIPTTSDNFAVSMDTTTAPVATATTASANLQTNGIIKSESSSDEATTLQDNLTTVLLADSYNPTIPTTNVAVAVSVDTTVPVATTAYSANLQTNDATKSESSTNEGTTLHGNLTTVAHSEGNSPAILTVNENFAVSVDTTTAPVATTAFSAILQTNDITESESNSEETTTPHENLTTFLHSDGYNPIIATPVPTVVSPTIVAFSSEKLPGSTATNYEANKGAATFMVPPKKQNSEKKPEGDSKLVSMILAHTAALMAGKPSPLMGKFPTMTSKTPSVTSSTESSTSEKDATLQEAAVNSSVTEINYSLTTTTIPASPETTVMYATTIPSVTTACNNAGLPTTLVLESKPEILATVSLSAVETSSANSLDSGTVLDSNLITEYDSAGMDLTTEADLSGVTGNQPEDRRTETMDVPQQSMIHGVYIEPSLDYNLVLTNHSDVSLEDQDYTEDTFEADFSVNPQNETANVPESSMAEPAATESNVPVTTQALIPTTEDLKSLATTTEETVTSDSVNNPPTTSESPSSSIATVNTIPQATTTLESSTHKSSLSTERYPNHFSCGDLSSETDVTFVNPSFPGPDVSKGRCTFKLAVQSRYVCQLRVDFNDTRMLLPRQGFCLDQQLTVSGAILIPGVERFCGRNPDQHFYLELTEPFGAGPRVVEFHVATSAEGYLYRYALRVRQIDCSLRNELRAPRGCFQYFAQSSGLVKSFNFEGGQYYNNVNYRICVRSIPYACAIAIVAPEGGFGIHKANSRKVPLNRAGVGSKVCKRDYLWIPSGPKERQLLSLTEDRYCGAKLSTVHGDNRPRPIIARVSGSIYSMEFRSGTPRKFIALSHGPGFRLSYTQLKYCPANELAALLHRASTSKIATAAPVKDFSEVVDEDDQLRFAAPEDISEDYYDDEPEVSRTPANARSNTTITEHLNRLIKSSLLFAALQKNATQERS